MISMKIFYIIFDDMMFASVSTSIYINIITLLILLYQDKNKKNILINYFQNNILKNYKIVNYFSIKS